MDVVLRSIAAYAFILLLLRLLGRRELSSFEPFDLILLVVIGDLVQQGVTQSDMSLTGTGLAVGTFALLAVGTSWLTFRFRAARRVLESSPLVVVQDGKPIERNMRSERLTLEEVAAQARLQRIPSLAEVDWAILESSGQISFITAKRED